MASRGCAAEACVAPCSRAVPLGPRRQGRPWRRLAWSLWHGELRAHFIMDPRSALHQLPGASNLESSKDLRRITPGHCACIYVIDGEADFAGEMASRHHCLVLSHDEAEDGYQAFRPA